MRGIAVVLTTLCLRAQTVLPPDLDTLAKIRTRMLFNLKHQPNYTCVETIERSTRPKVTNKLKIVDTLRLEVALVDGKEMFAWPGSKKFEESDVTQMVTTGAIGNGNFGTHARALFATNSATFHYLGEQDLEGKKSIRFDYNVPQIVSGYRIRVSAASAIVGYHGSFWADPTTLDVQRIQVKSENLPPELMLNSTEDIIDYAVTRIGEGDFLLPAQSQLIMIGSTGGEEHNHVKFSSCREFSGESVISFADPPPAAEAAPVATREFNLPEGLDIAFALTKDIDLSAAAIGDPVQARVDRDVKQNRVIVVPKGATATGRIVRLEKQENFSVIGIEFSEIEAPGMVAHLKGTLTDTVGIPSPRRWRLRTARNPGEGIIPVNATMRHLARGCIMLWRT